MHPALFMRRFERLCDLPGNGQRLVQWQGTLLDSVGQRWAFHQFHDEVIRPDIIQLANVGMVQRGDHPRFTFEPLTEPRS
jgi:hypothetical protein